MFEELRTTIERCLAGDQAAMRALVERYQGNVFGLCYRMLGRYHDAEDAAQETFVRALRSVTQVDLKRDFEPWLLAIAGNCCRTRLARRKKRPEGLPLLAEVSARALVIGCRGDLLHPAETAERLAESLPQATLHVYEEPHPLWRHRSDLRRRISEFLND